MKIQNSDLPPTEGKHFTNTPTISVHFVRLGQSMIAAAFNYKRKLFRFLRSFRLHFIFRANFESIVFTFDRSDESGLRGLEAKVFRVFHHRTMPKQFYVAVRLKVSRVLAPTASMNFLF